MNTRTPNKQLTDAQISNATLIRLIRWADEHKSHYVAAALRELQERRKAAMDSEPVAWTDEQELRDVDKDGFGYLFKVKPITPNADPRRIIKLYRHAQPVPVAIRNHFRAEALAELLKDAREYAPLTAAQWETLAKNWHQTFVGLSGEENACRAAMLKGGAA